MLYAEAAVERKSGSCLQWQAHKKTISVVTTYLLLSPVSCSIHSLLTVQDCSVTMTTNIDVGEKSESSLTSVGPSPLIPYCKGLRLIKLCGLPLKMKIMDDGSVDFRDHLRIFKCGVAMGKRS